MQLAYQIPQFFYPKTYIQEYCSNKELTFVKLFTSTPLDNNSSTTSVQPFSAATCNGVSPDHYNYIAKIMTQSQLRLNEKIRAVR